MFNNTPQSERSVYFDASSQLPPPSTTMQSSQDYVPPPVNNTAYALHDDGPVPEHPAAEESMPVIAEESKPAVAPVDTIANDTEASTSNAVTKVEPSTHPPNTYLNPLVNPLVEHPNGSEGWLPAEDVPTTTAATGTAASNLNAASNLPRSGNASPTAFNTHTRHGTGGTTFTTSSVGGGGGSIKRSSSRRSAHTASDGRLIAGSAFVNGAGTTGPYATAESGDDVVARTKEANVMLTPKQKSKIAKNEAKNGRRLSKIIKQEAKTEKKSLEIAIKELDNLQQLQKNAVKSEARVQVSHGKLIHAFKKAEAAYLNAKMKYETAQAELNAEAETLEVLRANAREATQSVQDKSAEVDALRQTLALDEREREVRLGELKGKRGGFWG